MCSVDNCVVVLVLRHVGAGKHQVDFLDDQVLARAGELWSYCVDATHLGSSSGSRSYVDVVLLVGYRVGLPSNQDNCEANEACN
mmetsp:Transcript_9582/g.15689  ORF Transcript_9582/g.15689 Transcript_9582/m.15689 type:complete len:84 (-) Transcript_9582:2304-2555(-)